MPGLIDAHWHAMFAAVPLQVQLSAGAGHPSLLAANEAAGRLEPGFRTVRSVRGRTFGLKRAIAHGIVAGPRIYPPGATISQASGHGDFRFPYALPRGVRGHLTHSEQTGTAVIADGVDE